MAGVSVNLLEAARGAMRWVIDGYDVKCAAIAIGGRGRNRDRDPIVPWGWVPRPDYTDAHYRLLTPLCASCRSPRTERALAVYVLLEDNDLANGG